MPFTGIITLLTALAISGVAAFVSVTGMMAVFPAVASVMMVAMIALETGKLVTANWLHSNWQNPSVSKQHRSMLTAIVVVLMLITSLGIYGFLSKGYLEQKAPMAGVGLQIAQKEQAIKMLESDNSRLQDKVTQLDANIDSFLKGDKAERANSVRNRQKSERSQIEEEIKQNNTKISALNEEILPLKVSNTEVEAKLGPIKYIAELFGWEDIGTAVRMVILMLIFVFDPLAVLLLLSSSISFADWRKGRMENQDPPPSTPPAPGPEVEPTPPVPPQKAKPAPTYDPDAGINMELAPIEPSTPREPAVFVEPKKKRGGNRRKPKAVEPTEPATATTDEEERNHQSSLRSLAIAYLGGNQELPRAPVEDQEKLIEILEKRPELLGTLIDVIRDETQPELKVQVPESEIHSQSGSNKPYTVSTNVSQAQLERNLKPSTSWLGRPKTP